MKNKIKTLIAIILIAFSLACKKEKKKDGLAGTTIGGSQVIKGCTDATASNYNSAANTNDGSCIYTGNAIFYYNSFGTNATVYLNGQSAQITTYYTNTPNCGASGCANFTLQTGIYNFSASSSFNTWNGQITITKNNCSKMLLQ